LDSSKLRQELNWHDQITLDQGIDESIAWVKKYFDVLSVQEHNYIHKP
jgi:dTDP-glucose 4,6-dehydratase